MSYILFSNKKNFDHKFESLGNCKTQEFAGHELGNIHDEDKILLEGILQRVLNEEKWIPFRYPVDFRNIPEYYAAVPYPIYTELIYKKAEEYYYRQNAVILFRFKLSINHFVLELNVGY